ncbi:MAG: amidohydrolase family protein [Micrococcales bacterium]|nr:amidohydrolase family protein [Micrococcales bacterium]
MTRTVLTGGQVFDGTGTDFFTADVAIEGDKIVEVGPGLTGGNTIDLAGATILPGLIDAHVHVCLNAIDLVTNLNRPFSYQFYLAEQNLKTTLDIGITTIRDASGADLGVQQAVRDGLIDGPDVFISIIALSQTGGHGDNMMPSGNAPAVFLPYPGRPYGVIDGPDEARRMVRALVRDGANVIKVNTSGGVFSPRDDPRHPHFTMAELEVITEEAARAGISVMAHAHGREGIKNAIRAGIRSIEHGTDLDDEAVELMVANGTWLVPTLGVGQFIIDQIEAGAAVPAGIKEKALENASMRADSFQRAVDAGVRIAMGSDCAAEGHGDNLAEFALMHQMGLPALQVLYTATGSAATLMGIEDRVGFIRAGHQADLTIVNGNPLDFAAYPGNLRSVFRKGVAVRGAKPPAN